MVNLKKRTVEIVKGKKLDPVDHIPNYPTQSRRPVPKRRSDFSSFFSSSSSDSGSMKYNLLSTTVADSHNDDMEEKELFELPLIYFRKSGDKKSKPLSDFYKPPVEGVESVSQTKSIDQCGDSKQTSVTTMESTPEKSQVAESRNICVVPGSVVWAKMDREVWWPAEVVGETASVADSRSQVPDGCVLVQFCGNHGRAWVDPARDLSQLEDCFEERSCNTTDEFQDALKQALKKIEGLRSHEQFVKSPEASEHSDKQYKPSNERSSSHSSKINTNFLKTNRRKRKPKLKNCSNQVLFPLKSTGTVRRLKIMRHLGLIAPAGSPF